MPSTPPRPTILDDPFRVSHTNGDVVAGFSDLQSAEDDAKERNQRALRLGLRARYIAGSLHPEPA